MSDLHKRVFDAIHALPRPLTIEQAKETGATVIGQDAKALQQWNSWMQTNGPQLIFMLNNLEGS